jgi:hypothetical protein
MPYKIVGETGGFRVCDQKKCFSKHPLTKKKAQKQIVAIALSESKKTGKPVGQFFL